MMLVERPHKYLTGPDDPGWIPLPVLLSLSFNVEMCFGSKRRRATEIFRNLRARVYVHSEKFSPFEWWALVCWKMGDEEVQNYRKIFVFWIPVDFWKQDESFDESFVKNFRVSEFFFGSRNFRGSSDLEFLQSAMMYPFRLHGNRGRENNRNSTILNCLTCFRTSWPLEEQLSAVDRLL